MDSIFHEKQEGSLCAQHCLNALLQGPYYTAVELAELASQLDEEERSTLHPTDQSSTSQNMNEEGYFSIQVINKALTVWSLELIPLLRQCDAAEQARMYPDRQTAFICHFRDHWFTIRRFGSQWFNLNSIMSKPRLISPTYLDMYLTQLMQEGHSIFFVTGSLPPSEADRVISLCPVPENYDRSTQPSISYSPTNHPPTNAPIAIDDEELKRILKETDLDNEDVSLQRVLEISQREAHEADLQRALELSANERAEEEMGQAIEMSLDDTERSDRARVPTAEEIRLRRQAFLDRFNAPSNTSPD